MRLKASQIDQHRRHSLKEGSQAGSVQGGGLFGSTQQNTGIFGVPASQPQSTGLFGAQAPTNTLGGFGANTNTFGAAAPAFGAQNQAASLFNKPANTFGQSTFNQQPASNLFGAKPFGAPTTTAATGFAGFGKYFFIPSFCLHCTLETCFRIVVSVSMISS